MFLWIQIFQIIIRIPRLDHDIGSISLLPYNIDYRVNLITHHLLIITELHFYNFPIHRKLL